MIAKYLGEQQEFDANPKAIQQINLTEKLATTFFILEEAREIILDFSEGTVKVL